ncbi:Tyrosine--tRNA ligase [compost metagenome]
MYHGLEAAEAAQDHFVTVFQQRALPDNIAEIVIPEEELEGGKIRLIKLLTLLEFSVSNGEARRSIQQGAVKLNEEKLTDPNAEIKIAHGDVIQVGKRKFAKLLRK